MPNLSPSDLRFPTGYLAGLGASERETVIGFLLRWEAYETAARLLDEFQAERLDVVDAQRSGQAHGASFTVSGGNHVPIGKHKVATHHPIRRRSAPADDA